MTLEQRIAKLKAALAAANFKKENSHLANDEYFLSGKKSMTIRSFEAGADALAEVYRLEGQIIQIENYGEKGGSIWEATKYKLEALLKQMEDGK